MKKLFYSAAEYEELYNKNAENEKTIANLGYLISNLNNEIAKGKQTIKDLSEYFVQCAEKINNELKLAKNCEGGLRTSIKSKEKKILALESELKLIGYKVKEIDRLENELVIAKHDLNKSLELNEKLVKDNQDLKRQLGFKNNPVTHKQLVDYQLYGRPRE